MELCFFNLFPSHCMPATQRQKTRGTLHLSGERLAFKIHCDRLTGLLKLMSVCPPSPPRSPSLSPCSLALVIALNLSLRFLESSDGHQDNHDGMLEASSVVTSLFLFFSLSVSSTHTSPPVRMPILNPTHTLDKLSSFSKRAPKHNHK